MRTELINNSNWPEPVTKRASSLIDSSPWLGQDPGNLADPNAYQEEDTCFPQVTDPSNNKTMNVSKKNQKVL